jgi:dephospho-CoA kinase
VIIAVSGRMSAGETTVCEVLETKGFNRLSLSDILREKLRDRGKEITRANLQYLGDKLRNENGMDVLARLALEKTDGGDWALDSIYTVEEGKYLRGNGAYLLYVTAPVEIRYKRALGRGEKYSNMQEFIEVDKEDSSRGIHKMSGEADFVVSNDGTIEELSENLDKIVETISSYARS